MLASSAELTACASFPSLEEMSSETAASMGSAKPRSRIRHTTGVPPPSPYPPGSGFASGRISLGEVDVVQVATFEEVWSALEGGIDNQGVTFYKPVEVPSGYSILGYYGQNNSRPRAGWVLAIKENGSGAPPGPSPPSPPSSSSSSPSPPSSPKPSLETLNPFAGLTLTGKGDASDVFNPFVGKHLSPRGAAAEAAEDNINPFSRASVVPNETAAEEHVNPFPGETASRDERATESDTVTEGAPEDTKTKSLLGSVSSLLSPSPALKSPSDFTLIWKSSTWNGKQNGNAWVWLPIAPEGYSALGYVVTNGEERPSTSEVACVRTDLTDTLAVDTKFFSSSGPEVSFPFTIWSTRPAVRGVSAAGVNVGGFFCAGSEEPEGPLPIACLKNVAFKLDCMPTMAQVETIQHFFGPTVVFHPAEEFLPSSVAWFFDAGAMLYSRDSSTPPVRIKSDGSNLPQGGTNDAAFWIDLPGDGSRDSVKKGNLETAKVHIHLKPVYGATYTDLQSWLFYPFNGPSTAKVGKVNIPLGRLGEHVSDWEHYTLRVSNFTGELEAIYFSQHSKGQWVKIWDLEFNANNKAFVYVAKNGHPCYAHQGDHLQGDEKRGVGLRNDTALSTVLLDSSEKFQVFSAAYMHQRGDKDAPEEPAWLHYMREWGPKIEYDRKKYLDKFLRFLPSKIRDSLEDVIDKLPDEVMGQEGPTGPSEKNMWNGDERS